MMSSIGFTLTRVDTDPLATDISMNGERPYDLDSGHLTPIMGLIVSCDAANLPTLSTLSRPVVRTWTGRISAVRRHRSAPGVHRRPLWRDLVGGRIRAESLRGGGGRDPLP